MARTTATVSFQTIELKGSLLPGSLDNPHPSEPRRP